MIGAPIDEVFDMVADERNEPRYNPRIVRAEMVSEGPVGKGAVEGVLLFEEWTVGPG